MRFIFIKLFKNLSTNSIELKMSTPSVFCAKMLHKFIPQIKKRTT
jgi:hypothetical protein